MCNNLWVKFLTSELALMPECSPSEYFCCHSERRPWLLKPPLRPLPLHCISILGNRSHATKRPVPCVVIEHWLLACQCVGVCAGDGAPWARSLGPLPCFGRFSFNNVVALSTDCWVTGVPLEYLVCFAGALSSPECMIIQREIQGNRQIHPQSGVRGVHCHRFFLLCPCRWSSEKFRLPA